MIIGTSPSDFLISFNYWIPSDTIENVFRYES